MDNTRLVLTIDSATFLLPADVQIAEIVKQFQGLQVVEIVGYGRNPRYKATGPTRMSIEIVPADDVVLSEAESASTPPMDRPIPAPPMSDDDVPL